MILYKTIIFCDQRFRSGSCMEALLISRQDVSFFDPQYLDPEPLAFTLLLSYIEIWTFCDDLKT